MSINTHKCKGHHHGGKFAGQPFTACLRCQHFDKNGQQAPALQLWISGLCPKRGAV